MSAEGVAPATTGGLGIADAVTLSKPRLNALTVFAVAAGWWSVKGGAGDLLGLLLVSAGAGLVAGGASAINQSMEGHRDARMDRTSMRPVAAGRVSPREAAVFGTALGVTGVVLLALVANWLTAALGAACLLWYVGIYTPLKPRTSLNTLAGTVPGALPPVMGVAAAAGELTPVAWFLFAVLAIWQIPHFLAIAWIYRDDYRRGGYAMLPVVPGGEASTSRQVVVQSMLLLVISLVATPLGLAGSFYFVSALVLGIAFLVTGVLFARRRTDESARLLMRASLVYLPLLLTAFAWDAVPA